MFQTKLVEFVTKISSMGEKKIIYIPKNYVELAKKEGLLGKTLKITLEKI